jgi:diguanylate cyclase (GGDEF)-like protein
MAPVIATATLAETPAVWPGSMMANRLRSMIAQQRLDHSTESRDLIHKILEYAAEAEQTIADQSSRISELEALTVTDELTGLANRRGFKQALASAIDLANRHNETGVVAYVDLDGFKPINDTYGHDAGDRILQHTAALLRSHVRTSDVVARLGGDEFAVLLVRAKPVDGMDRIDLLKQELNRTVYCLGDVEVRLQASLGSQTFGPGDTVSAVLRNADFAMYRDKRIRKAGN